MWSDTFGKEHGLSGESGSRERPLVSVGEAARLMGLSRAAVYRSIHKGDLPVPLLQISGRWRIPRRAVERLIAGELAGHLPEGSPAA